MEFTPPAERLKALPLQLVEIGDAIVIKRGRAEMRVSGEHAGDVLRMVLAAAFRGASRDEISAPFAGPQRESILALLEQLISRRFIVPEGQAPSVGGPAAAEEDGLDIFYWHLNTTRADVTHRLTTGRLLLVGVNLITRQIAASLRASGAGTMRVGDDLLLRNPWLFDERDALRGDRWSAGDAATSIVPGSTVDIDPASADCIVAASDLGGAEGLREWNEFCVLHEIAYLPVLLQDLVGYVGPLVRPYESACFECLRARQNAHMADARSWRAVESVADPTVAALHPSMASILGDLAALEVLKLIGLEGSLVSTGTVIEVNFLAREMKPRPVLKVPRCRVCSTVARTPAAPLFRSTLRSEPR